MNLAKARLPTGRVALEAVLRFAVSALQVEPPQGNWEAVLAATEASFVQWRTWS